MKAIYGWNYEKDYDLERLVKIILLSHFHYLPLIKPRLPLFLHV
jgi:hypothetical protein